MYINVAFLFVSFAHKVDLEARIYTRRHDIYRDVLLFRGVLYVVQCVYAVIKQ